ncbi:MAG: transporter ATP-binding protein [Francisellaceae bacterium]|nr:transporter ATP-binding protein [Francisellaceae bacterium]
MNLSPLIQAKNLSKSYGNKHILNNFSFEVQRGQVIGLIGANGAGKTTLLQSLTGLISIDGELEVLGFNPWRDRTRVLEHCSFIPDVMVLPNQYTVSELIELYKALYKSFNLSKTEGLLNKSGITRNQEVKTLSKGLKAQLHIALMVSIDASLLILDEPTLGLDIFAKERFYKTLIEDFLDDNRTIIISSHQIDELEPLLTQVMYIKDTKLVLNSSIAELQNNFVLLKVPPKEILIQEIRTYKPIYEFKGIEKYRFIFRQSEGLSELLKKYGDITIPSLTDIFTALHNGAPYHE